MRYLVILGLSLLVWGCEGCEPDCHCPPTETEFFVTAVTGSPDGGVVVAGWSYSHEVSDEPTSLDCSCVGEYASEKFAFLNADGSYGGEIRPGIFSPAMEYFGNELTIAGFIYSDCGRDYGWTPYVETRNADLEVIRYAKIECELFANTGYYDGYEGRPQIQGRVISLTNGTFLYYGTDPDSTYKMMKVSAYGEVIWRRASTEPWSKAFSLPNGEFVFVWPDYAEFYNEQGLATDVHGFSGVPGFYAYSATKRADGRTIVAGLVEDEYQVPDIRLYFYKADQTPDTVITLALEWCQDSVTVIEGRDNDELFLAYQQRDGCGTGLGLNLVRLSDEGEILAQESVGTPGMTVLRGMDLPDIGNFFVAAVSNWGRRDKNFYGKVAKFNSRLTKIWEEGIGS
ncbi:MAG: hypothetical protein IPP40_13230 [bacterium]|nr:hypothetical protein [bacterium]